MHGCLTIFDPPLISREAHHCVTRRPNIDTCVSVASLLCAVLILRCLLLRLLLGLPWSGYLAAGLRQRYLHMASKSNDVTCWLQLLSVFLCPLAVAAPARSAASALLEALHQLMRSTEVH